MALTVSTPNSGSRHLYAVDNFSLSFTAAAPDTTPPTFAAGSPSASTITASSFLLSSTINEVGKTYYVALPSGATAPTSAQVKAGRNAAGTPVTLSGNFTNPTANTAATSTVSGLTGSTTYDVYVVAEDAVPNLQTSPILLTVTTTAPVPTITTGTIAPATVQSGNDVTVSYTMTGTFNVGNVFTAVLSNVSGSFASGTTVLTTTGSAAGSLTVTIPAGTAAGTAYLIRVVASDPATTGSNSTNTLTVTAPPVAPTVSTTAATAITQNSAATGGNVTADGGATITARGVVYGTSPSPTIGGSGVTQLADGAPGTGTFTSSLTGLASSTQYYVAAYATNSVGTTYGTDRSFTTLAPAVAPTVSTTAASAITFNSASTGGNVSASGGAAITARGVVYSLTPNPTIGGSGVTQVADASPGTGTFTSSLTGLAGNTQYYVAAYATNSVGTTYGTDQTFTTTDTPLLGYAFPATNATAPTTQATNVTGSAFSRAASLTGTSDTPDFRSTGFPTSSASPAAGAATGYYQFTFTLAAGNTAALTTLVASDRSSGTGPTKWEVRTSLDGYTATVGTVQTNPTTTFTPRTVSLTGTAALANVMGSVTFRIYAYGGTNSASGTFGVDDVNLFGTISASTPLAAEPTTQPTVTASGTTTTTVQLNLSGGNGASRLVVVHPTAVVAVPPVDGTTYSANVAYGTTTGTNPTTGTSNFVVVADGSSTSVTITGLAVNTAYTVEAYAYNDNGTAGLENYLTAVPGTAGFTTLAPPAATYTWNGTGTSWIAAGSWTPSRATVDAADVLVFDGSTTPTAAVTTDFTTSQTVAQLILRNGVAATFNNTGNRTLNITNGNSAGADLAVGAGASLLVMNPSTSTTITGLTLQLGTGATAAISGAVTFDAATAGAAGTGAHRLLGSGTTSIEFLNGSAFTAGLNFNGNSFGNTSTYANNVVFRSGSRLEQAGGSQPFGLTAPATVLTMEASSLYVYSVPGNTVPPLSSRSFGNLEFNVGSGNDASSVANGALVILGDLTVTSGNALLNLDNTISIGGNINVNGANSTLTFIPDDGGIENVILNGATQQTIGGTSPAGAVTFGPSSNLQINNVAGVVLARPLALRRLTLTSGTLTTDATNLLTLADNYALSVAASNTSFVNGPLAHVISSVSTPRTILFPIGKGTIYRPLTLNLASQAAASTYTAEQIEGDPNPAGASNLLPINGLGSAPLKRVSKFRGFAFASSNTTNNNALGSITLSFGAGDGVNNPADAGLVVGVSSGGSPFGNLDRSAATGTGTGAGGAEVVGTLTSAVFPTAAASALFVLAATNDNNSIGQAINPLPVELTSFSAQRQTNGTVDVKWATASEKNSNYFQVQRSLDGREFATVVTVTSRGTSTQATAYTALDKAAPAAQLYYRLRQVDLDGTATFSPVVTVTGAGRATLQLYPNPTTEVLHVEAVAATPYRVLNLLGQAVLTGTTTEHTTLNVHTLPAGAYLLELSTAQGRLVSKFTKE